MDVLALAESVAEHHRIAVLTNNCRLLTEHIGFLNPPVSRNCSVLTSMRPPHSVQRSRLPKPIFAAWSNWVFPQPKRFSSTIRKPTWPGADATPVSAGDTSLSVQEALSAELERCGLIEWT